MSVEMNAESKQRWQLWLVDGWFLFSIVMVSIYLVAPFVGGRFLPEAVARYASWVVLALALRFLLKRFQAKKRVRLLEYTIIAVATVVNVLVWFGFPVNVVIIPFVLAGIAMAYRKQAKVTDS